MKILITAKTIPDIDGVSCAIALAHLLNLKQDGNQYEYKFDENVHIEAKFLLDKFKIKYDLISKKEVFDGFILVDFSEKFGLPSIVDPDKVILVIDHRAFPDYEMYPKAQYQIELIGAAATLITEKYMFNNYEIPVDIAKLLLGAIYSNTINFQSDTMTKRDERARDWLLNITKNNDFVFEMFEYKTEYILNNLEEILKADSKSSKVDDLVIDLYQLEVSDSEKVLNNIEKIKRIIQQNSVNFPYLILQDINKGKTYIYSPSREGYDLLRMKNLDGFVNPRNIWEIPHITMRKTILKKLYS